MPDIKPVSDLRNDTDVLKEARISLMAKLEEGEQSARNVGWCSADDVEKSLGL